MRISGLLINYLLLFGLMCGSCGAPCSKGQIGFVNYAYAADDKEKTSSKPVIGYVDTDVISKESNASKQLHEQFQKKQEELQSVVMKMEEALKTHMKELDEKRSVLSAEAMSKMQNDIENEKKELGEAVMKSRSFLERNYVKDVTQVGEVSKKVMAEVAKSEGVKLVIAKAGVLHSEEDALEIHAKDITKSVLDKLNKTLPSFKVNFEGADELPAKMRSETAKKNDKSSSGKK